MSEYPCQLPYRTNLYQIFSNSIKYSPEYVFKTVIETIENITNESEFFRKIVKEIKMILDSDLWSESCCNYRWEIRKAAVRYGLINYIES